MWLEKKVAKLVGMVVLEENARIARCGKNPRWTKSQNLIEQQLTFAGVISFCSEMKGL
jgi:hypothetical protein